MLPLIPFVYQLVTPIIISTIVDRLSKFGSRTDWTQVKVDTNKKIRAVLPDGMLSDAVVLFVDRRISAVAKAMMDTAEEQKILKMVVAGQWEAAGKEVLHYAFPNVTAA